MSATATMLDGAVLSVHHWTPAQDPWLHLVLAHGAGEHSGRYERVGRQFADAGLAVSAYDHRGHGASSGRRGDVERWTDLTADAGHMLAGAREAAGDKPVALMGHSMGGLVVLDAVLSGMASPDLLVLSSPAIGDGLPRWQHLVAPLIARVRPTLTLANGWGADMLSRDPAVGQAAAADPLYLEFATVRLGALAFEAQDRVKAGLDELRVPTLVTQGAQDRLVPPQVTEPLARVPGVTRVVYPRLRHETLFEPEGPEVASDMIEWLREAVARLAEASGSPLTS